MNVKLCFIDLFHNLIPNQIFSFLLVEEKTCLLIFVGATFRCYGYGMNTICDSFSDIIIHARI